MQSKIVQIFRGQLYIRSHIVKRLFVLLLLACVFVLNLALVSIYTDGDLYYYRNFYSQVAEISFWDVPRYQLKLLTSGEPVYGYLIWIAAHAGIPHDALIAALNTILLALVAWICRKRGANGLFVAFVFSNYYLLVLLTGAERLKVAFILVGLAAVVEERLVKSLLVALTPLAHIQMTVHLAAVTAAWLPRFRLTTSVSAKLIALIGVAVVAALPIAVLMAYSYGDVIYAKLLYYSAGPPPTANILKLSIVLVVGVLALQKKLAFILAMLVIMVATYIVGSDRFQISAIALLGYFAVMQNRSWHPAVLAIMAYFSYKSIGFMTSVFEYGHGFGHVVESVVNR